MHGDSEWISWLILNCLTHVQHDVSSFDLSVICVFLTEQLAMAYMYIAAQSVLGNEMTIIYVNVHIFKNFCFLYFSGNTGPFNLTNLANYYWIYITGYTCMYNTTEWSTTLHKSLLKKWNFTLKKHGMKICIYKEVQMEILLLISPYAPNI